MIPRLCNPSKTHSFFLFGARGTGKSTMLRQAPFLKNCLYIDLLKPDVEERYALSPKLFEQHARAVDAKKWIVLDEIQKAPKLLDIVHLLIEERDQRFALTGSSSRKLKRGGANLLAGRAFVYQLFPFSFPELGDAFALESALEWGSLPKIVSLNNNADRANFLRAYVQTYVKEEIVAEQLVRQLDPFRLFLPIAAQMNGQILNFTNIAADTGVDHKTVQTYFEILVDTNMGIFLNPYGRSVRKVQRQSPKFYFFDYGVKRALQRTLNQPLPRQTAEYGDAFETWFINECHRLNSYQQLDFTFSYLRTKDDVEIDLVIERPGMAPALVEIKSAPRIDERHIRSLKHFAKDFPKSDLICAAQVPLAQNMDGVQVLPWKDAFQSIGFNR
ncbi:MAG: hypothetical protein A3J74_03090 [Elusimicrobia bacterium RIFCSPHIGHO2_02_FULL_57_9]|nr:MAG: hypothetical protein A3J74_03090 [Elusimicrobia bacterium RIFCSPHIGHO2_02_FULL_57_9]